MWNTLVNDPWLLLVGMVIGIVAENLISKYNRRSNAYSRYKITARKYIQEVAKLQRLLRAWESTLPDVEIIAQTQKISSLQRKLVTQERQLERRGIQIEYEWTTQKLKDYDLPTTGSQTGRVKVRG
jgi:hypothetical protein